MKALPPWVLPSVAAGACGAAPPHPSIVGYDQYMSVVARTMREVHATFDGQPVSDVRPHGTCEAVVVTPRGGTRVRWKDMGILAPHLARPAQANGEPRPGDKALADIRSPEGTHTFAYPALPEAMNPAETVLMLLDGECADPRHSDWPSSRAAGS